MPNHIKNKITLIGDQADVKALFEQYSTFFPRVPSTAYDGRLIYEGSKQYEFGWLDTNTGVFERRNLPSSVGVPDGFTQKFDEAWTRFPDFEKVYPVPESIKAVGDSVNTSIVDAVKAKYYAPVSTNPLVAGLELMNRHKAEVKEEDMPQFLLACKAYEETGFAYWYDWNCEKWGTKWNAYSCVQLADNTYCFDTAWSGVPDIIKEISKSFNGTIEYKFADEDTGSNVGVYKFAGGIALEENRPKSQSLEAYELAFELRPDEKENYRLIDGKYEYIEEED